MSLATERCGRCGAALVSMETTPKAIGAIRCAGREGRARWMALVVGCTLLVAGVGAWQLLAI